MAAFTLFDPYLEADTPKTPVPRPPNVKLLFGLFALASAVAWLLAALRGCGQ